MKKIISGFLLALVALVLVACVEPTPPDGETDTEKPVIIGADDKTITQGEAFDPLAGVSVTDNVDTITLTLANVTGSVNVDVVGVYTLTYTVSDTAGNTATKERKITVVAPMPLGNLVGGDFAGPNFAEGWSGWHDAGSGYDVETGIVDGVAVVNIKSIPVGDSQWWGVQLRYQQIVLEPFVSYKLRFDIKADAPRYINHQIQGGGIPDDGKAYGEKNTVLVTTEWQTVEKDFYVKGAANNAELQFAMGAFAESVIGTPEEFRSVATKIYIDNVTIVEGPELENSAPVITAPNLVVKVGQETPIKQGVTVIDDFTALTPTNVTVTQTAPETQFNPANPAKGVYTFELYVEDAEGLSHTVTRTITVADPWNRPVDLTPTEGAADGWWVFEADEMNFLDVTQDGNVTAIEILEVADSDWKAMFRVDEVQFFAGTYEISFEIRADQERDVRIAIENAGLDTPFVHITAGEAWSYITLTYTFASNQTNKTFAFWLGSLTTARPGVEEGQYTAADDIATTVYLRNFNVAVDGNVVEPVWNVPTNMIVSTESEGWWVFESDGDWIDVTNVGQTAVVDIKAIAPDDWRAMFRVNGVNFKAGTYTIRFEAKADDARDIRIAIEGAGLTNAYEHISLDTDWVTFELVYEFDVPAENKVFAFWFGTLTSERPGWPAGSFEALDDVVTKVHFKNFRVEYQEGESLGPWSAKTDLVVQGEGDWGLAGAYDGWWIREVDHPEGVTNLLEGVSQDGVTSIEIKHMMSGDWQAAFLVEKVQFFAGVYTISFDVKADQARKVRVAIENAGLEGNVAFQDIQATTDWTTITLTYTFETDQLNKAFQFWFGSLTTNRDGLKQDAEEDILTTVHFRNFNVDFEELPA